MKLLMQGMRRNGTTNFFDVFSEDGRFLCWYEPLAAADKPCLGGGSGDRPVDFFDPVRRLREQMLREDPAIPGYAAFNFGAPRDASLEFLEDVPAYVERYLQRMVDAGEHVVIKFTRATAKAAVLHRVAPDAKVLLLVRDPRRVVMSYLLGKGARHRERYPDADAVFASRRKRLGWSAGELAGIAAARRGGTIEGLNDVERVLLLWTESVMAFHRSAARLFGSAYRIVRHEDLLASPRGFLTELYAFLGIDPSPPAVDYAAARMRPAKAFLGETDPRWAEAMQRVGGLEAAALCGYRF